MSDFTALDRELLANAEQALADGLAIKRWWQDRDAGTNFAETFPLIRSYNPADRSYGLFDTVPLRGQTVPVMGVVQESLFDRIKDGPALIRDELRDFVLHYFMRVSDFNRPTAYAPPGRRRYANSSLSWYPESQPGRAGFGYSQHYYKLASNGQTGKFALDQASEIIDLREIGPTYEWILVRVRIFDFNLTFHPFGEDGPAAQIPLDEQNYLLLSRDFIVNEDGPGGDGHYGLGYALLRNPGTPGLLAYGPGQFESGFQTIDFRVLADGSIHAKLAFVVNRPAKILNFPIDPADWTFMLTNFVTLGIFDRVLSPLRAIFDRSPLHLDPVDPVFAYVDLANAITGGFAARELAISRPQLEKDFLIQHFLQHYEVLTGALLTWRSVADWLNASTVPQWMQRGVLVQ
ncbi:MAG: hypothetical protein ACRD8O_24640 [Bryobacteraceae bacterium]